LIERADLAKLTVLVVVVGVGIYAAVKMVDHLHEDRRELEKDVLTGRATERRDAPTPAPASRKAPVERSYARDATILAVRGPFGSNANSDAGGATAAPPRIVVVRGDGSVARLPMNSKEAGPIVTALLDRDAVDDLVRAALEAPPAADGPYEIEIAAAKGGGRKRVAAEAVAALRSLSGRSFRAAAPPEAISVRLSRLPKVAEVSDAPPWPSRTPPDAHLETETPVDLSRDALAAFAAALKVGAVFVGPDEARYRVASFDLFGRP
jgi:hypothetical protein